MGTSTHVGVWLLVATSLLCCVLPSHCLQTGPSRKHSHDGRRRMEEFNGLEEVVVGAPIYQEDYFLFSPDATQEKPLGSTLTMSSNTLTLGHFGEDIMSYEAFGFSLTVGLGGVDKGYVHQEDDTTSTPVSCSGDKQAVFAHPDVVKYFEYDGKFWTRNYTVESDNFPVGSGTTRLTADCAVTTQLLAISGQNENSGFVDVFLRSGAEWAYHSTLQPAVPDPSFGASLSAIEGQLAVGVPGYNDGEGLVIVYSEFDDDGASQSIEIEPDGEGGRFGQSLSLGTDFLGVGAPHSRGTTGSVSVFLNVYSQVDGMSLSATAGSAFERVCTKVANATESYFGYSVDHDDKDGVYFFTSSLPGVGQVAAWSVTTEVNEVKCSTFAILQPGDTQGWVGERVALGGEYLYYVAPNATIQDVRPSLALPIGRIYVQAFCFPDRYVEDDPDTGPQCAACQPGASSVGGRSRACENCEGAAPGKPENAEWEVDCSWVCPLGFFDEDCVTCAEFMERQGQTLPDIENADWIEGESKCTWGCAEGYDVWPSWQEIPIENSKCFPAKPANSQWVEGDETGLWECKDTYFETEDQLCLKCSDYMAALGVPLPENAEWVDSTSTCDQTNSWKCMRGYDFNSNTQRCDRIACEPRDSCSECIQTADHVCTWCGAQGKCQQGEHECNEVYQSTCPSNVHQFVGGALGAFVGTLLLCVVFCFVVRRTRRLDRQEYDAAAAAVVDRSQQHSSRLVRRVLDVLTFEKFSSDTQIKQDDPTCCICLADYSEGEEIRTLPCEHVFHKDCIDSWLSSNREPLCPLCKGNVVQAVVGQRHGRRRRRRRHRNTAAAITTAEAWTDNGSDQGSEAPEAENPGENGANRNEEGNNANAEGREDGNNSENGADAVQRRSSVADRNGEDADSHSQEDEDPTPLLETQESGPTPPLTNLNRLPPSLQIPGETSVEGYSSPDFGGSLSEAPTLSMGVSETIEDTNVARIEVLPHQQPLHGSDADVSESEVP